MSEIPGPNPQDMQMTVNEAGLQQYHRQVEQARDAILELNNNQGMRSRDQAGDRHVEFLGRTGEGEVKVTKERSEAGDWKETDHTVTDTIRTGNLREGMSRTSYEASINPNDASDASVKVVRSTASGERYEHTYKSPKFAQKIGARVLGKTMQRVELFQAAEDAARGSRAA